MKSRDRGVFLKPSTGQMIKAKYLLLLFLKTDTHGILQLKHGVDLFCYGLELFASVCPREGVTLGCSCLSEVGTIWLC